MASYRVFRRHRDTTFRDIEGMCPIALPAPVFGPRSLVGMTMGARKRKAKFDAWHKAVTYGREVITRALRRCIATDRTKLRVGNVAIEYAQQRLRYRIGERLRPCPGCLECEPKDCDGCGFSLGSGEDCEVCDAHAVDRYVMGCDGSGLLPAKRIAAASREWDLELPPVDLPGCYLCGGEGWLPAFTCTAEGFRTLAEQPCPECSQAKRIAGGGR